MNVNAVCYHGPDAVQRGLEDHLIIPHEDAELEEWLRHLPPTVRNLQNDNPMGKKRCRNTGLWNYTHSDTLLKSSQYISLVTRPPLNPANPESLKSIDIFFRRFSLSFVVFPAYTGIFLIITKKKTETFFVFLGGGTIFQMLYQILDIYRSGHGSLHQKKKYIWGCCTL